MSTAAWKAAGALYLPTLAPVELAYVIPIDLLCRIAFQECSWRADVIDGTVKSDRGAVGMFQLEPASFPGIAIGVSWITDSHVAAQYLQGLHKRFDDWQYAVAAYDWGPGNADAYRRGMLAPMPKETSDYIAEVFRDVPIAGALLAVSGELES